MTEAVREFFRKKETVREGKVLDIRIEQEKELPIYSSYLQNMSLGMISFDRVPQTVERRYYIIETEKGNEIFSGNHNIQRGDDVIITETRRYGSTSIKIEKKN